MNTENGLSETKERNMWLAIFGFSILAGIAAALYLAGKIEKTGLFSFINSAAIRKVSAVLSVVIVGIILWKTLNMTNTIVVAVHVAVFMLLGDLIGLIIRKGFGAGVSPRIVDLCAISACIVYLIIGWILMHGMWETDYSVSTDKNIGQLRIAQIADSHIGAGFNGEGFAKRLAKIQETDPDILVITGDFVDDDSMKQYMLDACEALSNFKTKYGVYYCLGNHDMGYYDSSHRGYTGDELIAELEKAGVVVLRDEAVLVDDRFYVIGRLDADYGRASRLDTSELIKDLDKDKYMIVLDHQPTDYDGEAAAGVDLVLSGHTHGGQLWPLEYIQPIVSENNNVRGYERRGSTDFIVTDGISDWAVKFKTGCKSEFNIIDIN